MAVPTPDQAAQRWAAGMSGASQKMRDGVQSVTTAPGAKAARNADAYVAGVQRSLDKWRQNVAKVSLSDWQQAFIDKGLARVGAGATAAVPKFTQFMAEFLPHVAAGAEQVRNMPKGGVDNGIARAVAMIRHNAAFKRRG